jgi:hypothetical protein
MKIRPVGAELFHAEGRTYRRTHRQTAEVTKTRVAFRYFVNAPKNGYSKYTAAKAQKLLYEYHSSAFGMICYLCDPPVIYYGVHKEK